MVRAVVAVVVGYVVMFALVFVTFIAAYLALGTDRVFQTGTYDVSAVWLAVGFALSVLAALVGGYVCAWIARRRGPAVALAGLVLVLGLAMALMGALAPPADRPATRTADVGNMEAMKYGRTPTWIALINPLIGSAGVLMGARLREKA